MTETKELILNELGALCRLLPEERFGQIIFNHICSNCPRNDPFFILDEDLLKLLQELTTAIEKKEKKGN